MLDCTGKIEIKIGQIIEIPNHNSNCFVHIISEKKSLVIAENSLGYFCELSPKDVHVLEDIVLPEKIRGASSGG